MPKYKKIKIHLYNALIIALAIYASETWTLKKEDLRKLTVFENNCLRATVGKTVRDDRVRMSDIKKKRGAKNEIVELIKRRRLNWFGHVTRREESSYVFRSYKDIFHGKKTFRKTT